MSDELLYVERCQSGRRGPAWIGRCRRSRSGRTVYVAGLALQRVVRGHGQGNAFEPTTGDTYWISGVKRRGSNRHPSGAGPIRVERSALGTLLAWRSETELDTALFTLIDDLPAVDGAATHLHLNELLPPDAEC